MVSVTRSPLSVQVGVLTSWVDVLLEESRETLLLEHGSPGLSPYQAAGGCVSLHRAHGELVSITAECGKAVILLIVPVLLAC